MFLENALKRADNSKVINFLRRAFSSYFFPPVTAVISLACYYLGWDIVNILYLSVCGTLILLTCKDVTPILSVFLFMNFMISVKNSPSSLTSEPTGYYDRTEILALIFVAAAFYIGALLVRIAYCVYRGKFKPTPTFWGLCFFALALLINGVFSAGYKPLNILYGAALALLFLGIFVLGCGAIELNADTFKKIAYYFVIMFALAAIELIVAYATYDGLIVDGEIVRSLLFFGWSTYNGMGMLLMVSVPAWFYLAGKVKKFGWAFLFGGFLAAIAACFSMSRQAMLGTAVTLVVCCVWLAIWSKGKQRIINLCIMGGVALAVGITVAVCREDFLKMFSSLFGSLDTGSGRTELWQEGFDTFLQSPIFGVGFYGSDIGQWDYGASGSPLIPLMYHNTVVEIIAACGIVGLAAYVVHRTQTVISFLNNVNCERIFVAVTILSLLIVGLLDNHIFYLLPTLFYSMLVAVLTVSEKGEKNLKSRQ